MDMSTRFLWFCLLPFVGGLTQFLFPQFAIQCSLRFLTLFNLERRMPQSVRLCRLVGLLAMLATVTIWVIALSHR